MKTLITIAFLLGAVLAPQMAHADDMSDRTEAVRLCRAEVASRAGVALDEIRLDQVRARRANVRVDLDVWRDGQLQNVRCDVTRGDAGLAIAAINPPLTTATAAR